MNHDTKEIITLSTVSMLSCFYDLIIAYTNYTWRLFMIIFLTNHWSGKLIFVKSSFLYINYLYIFVFVEFW